MNTTRGYHFALAVTAVAGSLHAYENLAKSAEPSLAWFLWAMSPYALCLGIWARAATGIPAAVGVVIALAFDVIAYSDVFIHAQHSTAGLAMLFVPLWSTPVFCPVAMLVAWLAVRRRNVHEPHAP